MDTRIEPSAQAKKAPIGTNYVPATSRCEQRTWLSYGAHAPWPDEDMDRLQMAFLPSRRRPSERLAVFLGLLFILLMCGFLKFF